MNLEKPTTTFSQIACSGAH